MATKKRTVKAKKHARHQGILERLAHLIGLESTKKSSKKTKTKAKAKKAKIAASRSTPTKKPAAKTKSTSRKRTLRAGAFSLGSLFEKPVKRRTTGKKAKKARTVKKSTHKSWK